MDPDSWPQSEPIPAPCLGVYPVFTPPLITLWRRDLVKTILDSIENRYRVLVFGQIPGGRENNLKLEDGGLKVAIPEPVEDDSQKIQGGNGQGEGNSYQIDQLFRGFEDSSF